MLTVRDIDLFYGASQALKGVSFMAGKGEVTCVLGRNGVGKTSLIRGIVGHVPLRRGAVEWESTDISRMTAADRAGIALVPQGREIFPLLTVEENLRTGLGMLPRTERHVPEDIFKLFPVLRDMLRRRGGDLSGGQQQQLAIGRALLPVRACWCWMSRRKASSPRSSSRSARRFRNWPHGAISPSFSLNSFLNSPANLPTGS